MLVLRAVRTLAGVPLSAATAVTGTVVRVGTGTVLRLGSGAVDAGMGVAGALRQLLQAAAPDLPAPFGAAAPDRPATPTVRVDPRDSTAPRTAADDMAADTASVDDELADNVFATGDDNTFPSPTADVAEDAAATHDTADDVFATDDSADNVFATDDSADDVFATDDSADNVFATDDDAVGVGDSDGVARTDGPDPVPEVPEHSVDLPIERWDQLAPATLRPRLKGLTLEQLLVLQEWEREHAHRPQILTMLDTRIAKRRSRSD